MLPFFNGQNSIKSVLYALYYQISIRCATLIRRRWINPPDERRINMGNPGLNFLFRQIQIENPTRCSLWQIRISSLVCRISFRTLEHSYFEFVSELVRHSVWRIRISIFVLLPVPPGIEACPPILLADLSAEGGIHSPINQFTN